MEVELSRFVNDEWCKWGTYDVTDNADLGAFVEAIVMFAENDTKVKAEVVY